VEGGRGQPVEQRRLVEVAHAVQPQREPAPAEQLPGDLGVLALAGIVEGSAAETRGQQRGGEGHNQEDGDTAATPPH
jgi:hypothetical protein